MPVSPTPITCISTYLQRAMTDTVFYPTLERERERDEGEGAEDVKKDLLTIFRPTERKRADGRIQSFPHHSKDPPWDRTLRRAS